MKHLVASRRMIIGVILAVLLIAIACLPFGPKDSPAATQESSDSTLPPEAEVEVVFGPGLFILPETVTGLSDLSSYRATLILTFEGTQTGQPDKWSKTYVMSATKEPAARQLTLEKAGDLPDLTSVFMAEEDGAAYERRGENSCIATVIEKGNLPMARLEPASFLTGVVGAEEAGSETVNGVAANRYTFDERALGQLGLTKSTGELWVASDEGYIVKYLLTTKGTSNYFGDGIEGTLTWDYELTDINQPLSIEIPKDCPAGLVNAPLLLDATNILSQPGLLVFNTPTSLTDASSFYQEQIPALGWEPVGAPAISDAMFFLDYTQGDKKMTLMITAGKGVTTVRIVTVR